MADLLRTGNTMLNLSCPICNNPLFRNREEQIFCSVCNREVQIVTESKAENIQEATNQKSKRKSNLSLSDTNQKKILLTLRKVLINKLDWIINGLESETQMELIERDINLVNSILRTLRKLENLIN